MRATQSVGGRGLQTPYIDVQVKHEVESGSMDGKLAAAIKIWKKVGEFVSSESVCQCLHDKLDIWALITAADKMESAFEETERSTDGGCGWSRS
jgi:hypothetical protein